MTGFNTIHYDFLMVW